MVSARRGFRVHGYRRDAGGRNRTILLIGLFRAGGSRGYAPSERACALERHGRAAALRTRRLRPRDSRRARTHRAAVGDAGPKSTMTVTLSRHSRSSRGARLEQLHHERRRDDGTPKKVTCPAAARAMFEGAGANSEGGRGQPRPAFSKRRPLTPAEGTPKSNVCIPGRKSVPNTSRFFGRWSRAWITGFTLATSYRGPRRALDPWRDDCSETTRGTPIAASVPAPVTTEPRGAGLRCCFGSGGGATPGGRAGRTPASRLPRARR